MPDRDREDEEEDEEEEETADPKKPTTDEVRNEADRGCLLGSGLRVAHLLS